MAQQIVESTVDVVETNAETETKTYAKTDVNTGIVTTIAKKTFKILFFICSPLLICTLCTLSFFNTTTNIIFSQYFKAIYFDKI